jgi:hypothetical protein
LRGISSIPGSVRGTQKDIEINEELPISAGSKAVQVIPTFLCKSNQGNINLTKAQLSKTEKADSFTDSDN